MYPRVARLLKIEQHQLQSRMNRAPYPTWQQLLPVIPFITALWQAGAAALSSALGVAPFDWWEHGTWIGTTALLALHPAEVCSERIGALYSRLGISPKYRGTVVIVLFCAALVLRMGRV